MNRKRTRVLWIEDGAAVEVPHLATPLFMSSRYDLIIAKDASEGVRRIARAEPPFDVVIFDLHLAPGDMELLIDRYQSPVTNSVDDSTGMSLLIDLFDPTKSDEERAIRRPAWLTADKVGVLSVESWDRVGPRLESLGIIRDAHVQKNARTSETALKDLVDRKMS